ncbi:MAG: hypothetical protein UW70_C0082G0002 [Candidatus Peregrinibacteria bacterium GW2011_GWA2_44_7]|nr:MAG: hypothetical protein UW70_C0082G0002 [Candidatus Peregrinibacteria bacterium GW2011_GWA2_44_7]
MTGFNRRSLLTSFSWIRIVRCSFPCSLRDGGAYDAVALIIYILELSLATVNSRIPSCLLRVELSEFGVQKGVHLIQGEILFE